MIDKIRQVIEEINKNNISYCILRNYNFLIEQKRSLKKSELSIDMVVSKDDFAKFHDLLFKLGFNKRKLSFSHKHVPFFRIEDNLERIHFDVQIDKVHWNDVPYMDVLNNRRKFHFFYVPSNNDTYAMLLIHSILGKRYFKPEYQEILKSSKIDQDYILDILRRTFKNKAKTILSLAQNHQFQEIIDMKLHFKFARKHPFTFTKVLFRWIKWKKFFAKWPLITFIGPDGSGKSTTAKALSDYLSTEKKKNIIIYTGRGRNQILPIRKVGNLYKSNERKKDNNKKTKKSIIRKVIYSIWAPVFTVDLLLRYFFVL